MSEIELGSLDGQIKEAVRRFWSTRQNATRSQELRGTLDQGQRSATTSGKNLDGFVELIAQIVKSSGLKGAHVYTDRKDITLPGFFRATKDWDLLVIQGGRLLAALELKSQVGPSFGNNFNNRTEEAIGTAHDFWTAVREGALSRQPRPFTGWIILVEEAEGSTRAILRDNAKHFPSFPEFARSSYIDRYELLCTKMVAEGLYTQASLITARRENADEGLYREVSDATSFRRFVASFSAHLLAEKAVQS